MSSFLGALQGLVDIAIADNIGSWQGDLLVVVIEGRMEAAERGGFLTNAYGSCGGCDAWFAANTAQRRLDILTERVNSIRWFNTPADMLTWLKSDAPELEWFSHEEQWQSFVNRVEAASYEAQDWSDFYWNLPVQPSYM